MEEDVPLARNVSVPLGITAAASAIELLKQLQMKQKNKREYF